jgi:ATP/maltotriose-dependent transcriptional regulator MalT
MVNGSTNTLIPAHILERYARLSDICPILIGQPIPPSTDAMIEVLQKEVAFARDRRNWVDAAQIALVLGLVYFEKNNLHDARQYTFEALTILRDTDDKIKLARALSQIASIEYYSGNPEEAIVFAREAAEVVSELSQPLLHGFYLCTVGSILCYMGQYKQGEEALQQAQALFAREEDDLGMAWWQYTQARELMRDRSECAEAAKMLEQALPTLRDKVAPSAAIEAMLALADNYICMGDLPRGQEVLKKAEQLIIDGRRYWYRPEMYLVKARLAIAENNIMQAVKFAYTGLGVAGDQGDLRVLATLYRTIASILERDRTRTEDTQDSLDRAIATGRKRARRIDLALSLQQAGSYFKTHANRPTVRARSAGFLFEAERMLTEMGIKINTPQKPNP